jgi:hypothetical protein
MSNVYMYVPVGTVVIPHEGEPPVDQSAEVARLTQELADANDVITEFKAFRDVVVADAQARADADAAKTEGQNLLDAAGDLPA